MRILVLVLLLILNAYAEAKSSGSSRSQSQAKKAKSTVIAKNSVQKSKAKTPSKKSSSTKRKASSESSDSITPVVDLDSAVYNASETLDLALNSQASANTSSDAIQNSSLNATEPAKNVVVVRDTVVDTVYVVYKDTVESRKKKEYNIPLPHQSAFLGEGFSVGIGAGLFSASKECDCLGVWQGQLEFHYKDFITGGFDVRFFGGTLDRDVMLMYQRYRLNTRFHKSFSGADFYVATLFGLETTDLSEFRKELREGFRKDGSPDDADSPSDSHFEGTGVAIPIEESDSISALSSEKNCEKMFSLDGFTLGLEVGMGVAVSRYLGFVGSATYEFNFSWTQLVAVSPGIAFNLREIWPWAGRNLRSTWISFEMVFQRYFNRDVKEWALAGFLGVQFGI